MVRHDDFFLTQTRAAAKALLPETNASAADWRASTVMMDATREAALMPKRLLRLLV
jgi:uridine phosphorylase